MKEIDWEICWNDLTLAPSPFRIDAEEREDGEINWESLTLVPSPRSGEGGRGD